MNVRDENGRIHGEFIAYHIDSVTPITMAIYHHGIKDGEYKTWYSNGQLHRHNIFKLDSYHGEYKMYLHDGVLIKHTYYVNDSCVHNFLVNPLDEAGRMLLVLKYGAPLFPKEVV